MRYKIILALSAVLLTTSVRVLSEDKAAVKGAEHDSETKSTVKIKGLFKVTKVEKKNDHFIVNFKNESEEKNQEPKAIFIEIDSINTLIQEEEKIFISAEIKVDKSQTSKAAQPSVALEASQILMHLPRANGTMKVWLLSRKEFGFDLKGTSFLEMHSPQNDFTIF